MNLILFVVMHLFFLSIMTFGLMTIFKFVYNKKIKYIEMVSFYGRSNIAKYLPGSIFQYVNRHIVKTSVELENKEIFYSSILEIISIIVSIIIIILILKNTIILLILLLFIIPILIALKKDIRKISIIILIYLFAFLVYSVIFLFILPLFYKKGMTMEAYFNGIYYYLISWTIGFITPGVSGGIGIREASIVKFMAEQYGAEVVFYSAVYFRIITIIGDILFYFWGITFNKKDKKD